MNKDYKELIEYLDEKFTKIEKNIEKKAEKEIADKILAGQDDIVSKLDKLLQEKTIGDAQDKRKTRVLEIHNKVLKDHKILSDKDIVEINKLRVF